MSEDDDLAGTLGAPLSTPRAHALSHESGDISAWLWAVAGFRFPLTDVSRTSGVETPLVVTNER